ncbi:MAG: SGNH/GDSL hydrolase family protein [Gammaproteobacteria bacterium]|jgi:lysophospholipase L1-like esterase
MKRSILLVFVLILACLPAAAQERWIGTWGASPLPPTPGGGPFPQTPGFENQTIRQIVRLSAGGDRLRLRLSNEYGAQPLEIGAASVAIARPDGSIRMRTQQKVTFGGQASAVIPAGAPLLSDPVDLAVDELEIVSVSLYLPGMTGACTCHQTGMQMAEVSAPGDFTDGTFEPADTIQARAFLSGIEVRTDEAAGVVVTFGDSITDGVGSTVGANNRWPDVFAERLAGRSGPSFGVVNQGISGNRVLSDGAGESAIARFDRDVLSVPGVTHVIVFEGINDVGVAFGSFGEELAGLEDLMPRGPEVTEQSLIAGYRQLIARAHSKGLKIYGATIAPYEGAAYYADEGERVRLAVNAWMRTSGEFDAVIDFDAVLRDPEQPSMIAEGLHSGDFLHGSDAGYEAMAASIDLALFR